MLLFEIWWLSLLFSQNLDFLVDTQLVKQCAANNAKVNAKCRLSCFGFIFCTSENIDRNDLHFFSYPQCHAAGSSAARMAKLKGAVKD